MAGDATYRILGRVIRSDTGDGVPGVLVKAWDADLLFDDLVGSAPTDPDGRFHMDFDERYFRELFFDRRPDLYFEVFWRGRCVFSGRDYTRWNLDRGVNEVVIELDPAVLQEETDPDRPVYPDPRQDPDVPSDNPVHPGPRITPATPGPWKDDIKTWWADRKRQREEDGTLHVPEKPIPKPFLDCSSKFGPQLRALALNEPGEVSFTVWNDGNAPAWTCYVEVYEGPSGYSSPLSAYGLRGRRIISLRPGERREVRLPWVRREASARIVGIVFDPLLDPKDFTLVEQRNRHITSVHYTF